MPSVRSFSLYAVSSEPAEGFGFNLGYHELRIFADDGYLTSRMGGVDVPLSFEVFSDDFDTMEKEARVLAGFGDNVFVKIPVTNTKGEHSTELIRKLSHDGLKLNVTAVFTVSQAEEVLEALDPSVQSIVSIFAGRITNAGVDAEPIMREVSGKCREHGKVKLLWASSRELFNVIQAERSGTDIITLTDDLLKALPTIGKDLYEYSLDTVKMFYNDGRALGYRIL